MIDFLAGLCCGVAITLSGHPFDTVKVRMQTSSSLSMVGCFAKTLKADGFRGYFYGISSPLASVPFVNAVVFAAYAQANSFITIENDFLKKLLSGSYAGLVNTLIVTPVELIKIKMQIQSKDLSIGTKKLYDNSIDCIVKLFKSEGIKGFYKGGVSTIYREIPGYSAQFASFEGSNALFQKMLGREDLPMICIFISGMVGGFNAWFWSYPQDIIKTKIQAGHKVVKGWDGGFNYLTKEIWRAEGWKGFWKGFSVVILRSTVPNGFGFLAYNKSKALMESFAD